MCWNTKIQIPQKKKIDKPCNSKKRTRSNHNNKLNKHKSLIITPGFINTSNSSDNSNQDIDIRNEIKDSGPIENENRDSTFLIIIHKDYIPPKGTQLPLPQTSTTQLYANLQYLQYAQAIDDSLYYHSIPYLHYKGYDVNIN